METQEGKENHAQLIESLSKDLGANSEVFLAAQSAQRAAGSIYLPVILPNGDVEEKPSFLFKTSEWTEAYALNKQTSYVFAYTDLPKVHLATERMLAEFGEYGELSFAPNCSLMAKLSPEEIDAARRGLPDDWIAHRLPPNYLDAVGTRERMKKQRERLASHLNSIEPDFGQQMVEAWLSQFPDPDLRDSALAFVERLHYVEPAEVVRGFKRAIEHQSALSKSIWAPLKARGGRGKSADQLTYDLKELGVQMRAVSSPDDAAKIKEAGSLVFFDDSLNSGIQSSCLLLGWFGMSEKCAHPSDMDPDGKLHDSVLDTLKTVPVTFVFYSKHPKGEARLKATCKLVGIQEPQIYSVVDASREEFRLSGLKCDSLTSRERFVGFLRDKGKSLLMEKVQAGDPGWDESMAERFALGYDELDLTIVYHHNISASTPVVLWRMSTGPVEFWLPLFPRERDVFRKRIDPAKYADQPALPEYNA